MRPAPIAAARGGRDRELWCIRYDDCLDQAVREAWEGFACTECPLRGTCNAQPEPPRSASVALMAIEAAEDLRGFTLTERETKRTSMNDGRGRWNRWPPPRVKRPARPSFIDRPRGKPGTKPGTIHAGSRTGLVLALMSGAPGEDHHSVAVAARLGISRDAVSKALRRLVKNKRIERVGFGAYRVVGGGHGG